MNDLDLKQPALIGGLIAGFLSGIPVVGLVNTCCCAWLLVGGVVAAKLLINRTPRPVKSGEGAQVGAIAGLIAAAVYLVINIPLIIFAVGERLNLAILERFAAMNSNPEFQELMQRALEESANRSAGQRLVASLPVLFVSALLFVGFSALGGLLGVALFEKRKNQQPPSYPPAYPPQYPPNYPPQSAPSGDNPPQYPPQSGGDQGGWPQG
jgi:uncharacterized membrane-anchored protein YitT (DUF2179 family)